MLRTSIPTCDITTLRSGSMREQARLVLDIGSAARSSGVFAIVNHGVDPDLTGEGLRAAQQLFDLPSVAKERLSFERERAHRGFAPLTATQSEAGEETFIVGLEPEPNRWPDLAEFRATSLACLNALSSLARQIERAFALDLGMPGDFFSRAGDRPLTSLRVQRFMSREPGFAPAGHANPGIITLLVLDDAADLEVLGRDGVWTSVERRAGAIVCTVGDCLMRWSNDRYLARAQRVVNRADSACHALAFFSDPNPNTLIACLPTCRDEENPPKYAPISYGAYAQERAGGNAAVSTTA